MSQAFARSESDCTIETGAESGPFAQHIVGIPSEGSGHNKRFLEFVNFPELFLDKKKGAINGNKLGGLRSPGGRFGS